MILAVGAATLPLPSAAQETVVVTKPADAKPDKANSFMGNPDRRINAGDYKAPKQLFNDFSPTLPMPHPLYLGNANPAAADETDRQKNWTLLTPAEILGVQTPEDILGTKKKDQDLSVEDQYLLRLRSQAQGALTNGRAGGPNWRDDNNPFNQRNLPNANNPFDNNNPFNRYNNNNDNSTISRSRMANAQQPGQYDSLSRLLNPQDATAAAQQRPASIWTSPFDQQQTPQPNPKTTQEQLDAMERFRALMQPSSPPDKITTQVRYSPAYSPTYSPTAKSGSDSFFQQQPQYNPAGRSVDLLEDNSTRPVGLQPLPDASTRPKVETEQPAWKPQLPPWMRKGPQSH